MVFSNLGATLVSLFVKDSNGNFSDIVLGYDEVDDYSDDSFYIGSVVGRYANRINGDAVLINDKQYKIAVRDGGYHLHGGNVGFNKKIFNAAPFILEGIQGISFKYTSPHLEEGFPGDLELEVLYTLDDDDQWVIEYKAVSNRPTLINLTQHTYFNLSGKPELGIGNHELQILSDYYLPVNQQQVPTGDFATVKDTPFDFTLPKIIYRDIDTRDEQLVLSGGYDHSYVLEKIHTGALKHAAVVKEPTSQRRMDVYTTEPAVHFYSGNFLEGITGKNKSTYGKRSGFCLETQHFPDAPNHPHFPSTLLQAGEVFMSKTIFKFSVE